MTHRPPLEILLANPRGFCAGVERAVKIVERALDKWGAPVYVRHQIVHNHHVVARLERLGAVFVDEISQCPDDRPVVFSAHGAPEQAHAEARDRGLDSIDATCPLVSRIHARARLLHDNGAHIILIGHAGHPEVTGTMGQVPAKAVSLVETRQDAASFLPPEDAQKLAFLTQTTLSVDDTAEIIQILKQRFPDLEEPADICYATTNRQQAVRSIAAKSDLVLVIGSDNSSNAKRLVEVASATSSARLVANVEQMDWQWLDGVRTLGISAGASTPELLIRQLIAACRARFEVRLEEINTATESVYFRLPRQLETTTPNQINA